MNKSLLTEGAAPCLGFKARYDGAVFSNEQRALYQHTIACQQLQLFFLAHLTQLGCQIQLTVLHAAGVEKAFQRQPACLPPAAQLFCCGSLLCYVAICKCYPLLFKPLLGFLAGRAFRIFDELRAHENYLLLFL